MIIKRIDYDKNGEINYSEWLMTVVSREKIMSQEKLESIFKLFDKDKSSTISVSEIEEMIGVAVSGNDKLMINVLLDTGSTITLCKRSLKKSN